MREEGIHSSSVSQKTKKEQWSFSGHTAELTHISSKGQPREGCRQEGEVGCQACPQEGEWLRQGHQPLKGTRPGQTKQAGQQHGGEQK